LKAKRSSPPQATASASDQRAACKLRWRDACRERLRLRAGRYGVIFEGLAARVRKQAG